MALAHLSIIFPNALVLLVGEVDAVKANVTTLFILKSSCYLTNLNSLFKVFSLAENVPTRNLSIYELVYSQPYSYTTTTDEINEIRSQCTTNSLVCLGGSSKDDQDHLILVSCGNCLEVLAENPLQISKLINGAYWYFRSFGSFGSPSIGFSDTDEVNYNNCDFTSPDDTKKLCWQLDFGGGGRLGTVLYTTSDCYYKKIYKTIDV